MGSGRLAAPGRLAAVAGLSLVALTSLPPSGTPPASAAPGRQADHDRLARHVISLLPTWGHDASRAPSCQARIAHPTIERTGTTRAYASLSAGCGPAP